MQVLGISGSLRAGSINTRVIEAAALCAPHGLSIIPFTQIGGLPFFNPDLDRDPVPPPVLYLRRLVGESAGLLICSPEYARGVSGVMKNALDWLVGSVEFPGKPVAVLNLSQRATDADRHLRLIVSTMNARLVNEACVTLPLLGRTESAKELVADPTLHAKITTALEALQAVILASAA